MEWDIPPPLTPASPFPEHQRIPIGHGTPWPAPFQNPPAWAQPHPPTSAHPVWATNAQNFQQHSSPNSWHAPSPFQSQGMDLGNNDSWAPTSASNIPTSPSHSTFGQPITPSFFGPNTSPRRNESQWNGIVRSTSDHRPRPSPNSSPWWSQSESDQEMDQPKSAGPWGQYSPSRPNRIGLPAHLSPDTWDETNLARRPRDWRAGYNPRASFLSSLSALPSALKSQSDVQEVVDNTKRRLAPSLTWHATHPPVIHDLRLDPLHHSTQILHAQLSTNDFRKPFTDLDMAQFATTPTADFLRLFHPKLPWYIDIRPTHPNGITVYDILSQLYNELQQPIMARHYWNEVLNEKDRKDIGKAYDRRVKLFGSGRERGILWIDFLCGEIVFEGLTKAKGGLWEIKTRNAYQ